MAKKTDEPKSLMDELFEQLNTIKTIILNGKGGQNGTIILGYISQLEEMDKSKPEFMHRILGLLLEKGSDIRGKDATDAKDIISMIMEQLIIAGE